MVFGGSFRYEITSVAEALVSEVLSMSMTTSTPEFLNDRLPIGQILVRLLHHLRRETFAAGQSRFPGLRFPHLQILGNMVGIDGIRLTELASRATLSLAACSELVNELQALGYLERRPDPRDGRAKLIVPTPRGRELLGGSQLAVAWLEQRWASHCAPNAFEEACSTLDQLLRSLGEAGPARAEPAGASPAVPPSH